MNNYGIELILDLHNCDSSTFNRKSIRKYFKLLCEKIDMQAEKICWWDDHGLPKDLCQTESHTKGTTAVQFILTSNITIHTLDILKNAYINVFSCKEYDAKIVEEFSKEWFKGEIVKSTLIERI
jgi:S-adenosylmethionine/arginine decarboxylase-like enzyme